jgi:hypothetical protein
MSDTEEEVAEGPQPDVHWLVGTPVFEEVTDNFPGGGFVLKTKCGKIVNDPVGLSITDDEDDVTCQDCLA